MRNLAVILTLCFAGYIMAGPTDPRWMTPDDVKTVMEAIDATKAKPAVAPIDLSSLFNWIWGLLGIQVSHFLFNLYKHWKDTHPQVADTVETTIGKIATSITPEQLVELRQRLTALEQRPK